MSVCAVNDIGESPPAYLDILAASVPQKLGTPVLISSTTSAIKIQALPSFNGGDPITQFVF
jgi:hypothetical protein